MAAKRKERFRMRALTAPERKGGILCDECAVNYAVVHFVNGSESTYLCAPSFMETLFDLVTNNDTICFTAGERGHNGIQEVEVQS